MSRGSGLIGGGLGLSFWQWAVIGWAFPLVPWGILPYRAKRGMLGAQRRGSWLQTDKLHRLQHTHDTE